MTQCPNCGSSFRATSPSSNGAEGAGDENPFLEDAKRWVGFVPPQPAPDALREALEHVVSAVGNLEPDKVESDELLSDLLDVEKRCRHILRSEALAELSSAPVPGTAEPVAWRWRYKADQISARPATPWNVRIEAINNDASGILEIEPLYAAPVRGDREILDDEKLEQYLLVSFRRWGFDDKAIKSLTYTAWKDGIDIDRVDYSVMQMARDIVSLPSAPVSKPKRWYLASQNDGLFIINTMPRPSNDDQWHDRPDGPSVVLNVTELPEAKAIKIVGVMNDIVAAPVSGRDAVIEECARVAESGLTKFSPLEIARAIRALSNHKGK